MRPIRFAVIATACTFSLMPFAYAHSFPKIEVPPMNGTVKSVPTQVAITFTEELNAHFSGIRVENSKGQRVDTGAGHLAANHLLFTVALKPIGPGTYTVLWHALSDDGHKTHGEYRFTVAP
ncbi:copper resistance protein CopC [Thiomonas sp. X19]|uniref:copper resistance CopC family protein n=1 Tax=Thiomonas sp. X19 TaxID=1050370 RepID=UPI000DDB09AA|nr:copper resistance protein CopC [Thiomonas sp. X19]